MTKLYLSYNVFLQNIIYQNNNLLVNKTNLYFSYTENENIINTINIFLLILYFHYTKFLKIIIEMFI